MWWIIKHFLHIHFYVLVLVEFSWVIAVAFQPFMIYAIQHLAHIIHAVLSCGWVIKENRELRSSHSLFLVLADWLVAMHFVPCLSTSPSSTWVCGSAPYPSIKGWGGRRVLIIHVQNLSPDFGYRGAWGKGTRAGLGVQHLMSTSPPPLHLWGRDPEIHSP